MSSTAPFREYWAIIRGSKSRMRCLKWSLVLLVIVFGLLAVSEFTGFGQQNADALFGLMLALLIPVSLLVAMATGLDPSMREYPPLHDEIFQDLSRNRESD